MKRYDSIEQKLRELGVFVEPKKSLLSRALSRLPSVLQPPIKYYDVRVKIGVIGSSVRAYSGDKYVGFVEGNSNPIKKYNGRTIKFRTEVQDTPDGLRFLPYLPETE